jgi:hypothetical protein
MSASGQDRLARLLIHPASDADPRHPVRGMIVEPDADLPAAGGLVLVEPSAAFVRHFAGQQVGSAVAIGHP